MKKALFLFLLIPELASAQSGVILPEGSNTLKSLHMKGYPGLGIYSPSAGVILFGNGTDGISCTWGGSCTLSMGAVATGIMVSTLATNAPDVAASVWGVSNRLDFEGATANDYETELTVADPTADRLLTFPDATGTVFISTLATNAPDVANSVWGISNSLVFEGATGGADAFETSVTVVDPTADRTFTLPNASGVPVISSLSTNAPDAANSIWTGTNEVVFEGATGGADAFETTITPVDPTADNVITLPNATGTVMVSTLASNAPDAAHSIWGVQGALYFEGTTANEFETVLSTTDATADRSIVLPNAAGTVFLTGGANNAKSLTDAAAATPYAVVAVATNGWIAGELEWTATSVSGADQLVANGAIRYWGTDTAGTPVCGINKIGTDGEGHSGGANTLVCTWTNVVSTTNCALSVTCTNDLAGSQAITLYGVPRSQIAQTVTYP